MVSAQLRAKGLIGGLVRTRGCANAIAPRTDADGVFHGAVGAVSDDRQVREEAVHQASREDRGTSRVETESKSPARKRSASDIEKAARILYTAFNKGGYAPRWETAGDRIRWRRAAEAILNSLNDGSL